MNDIEKLRHAAHLIRNRALEAADDADEDVLVRWQLVGEGSLEVLESRDNGDDVYSVVIASAKTPAAAEHIATWHPGITELVARYLEDAVNVLEHESPDEHGYVYHALCIADAYLENES